MTWVRLDDNFPWHKKARAAGLEASMFWIAALCYCAKYKTDGRVPKEDLHLIWPADVTRYVTPDLNFGDETVTLKGLAERVTRAGLWTDEKTHFLIKDYLEYQPSRNEVDEIRRKNRERQKRYRERHVTRYVTQPVTRFGAWDGTGNRDPDPDSDLSSQDRTTEQAPYPAADVDAVWARYQENRVTLDMKTNGHMHRSPSDEFLIAGAVKNHGGLEFVIRSIDIWKDKIQAGEATWRREDYRLEILLKPKNIDRALHSDSAKKETPAAPYLNRVWDGEKLVKRR